MTIAEEINRRVNILNKFNKKMGVKVEFLGSPGRYYTYLSDTEIKPGIFKKPTTNTSQPIEIVRVHECGHEVLYKLDDSTLDIILNKGVEFDFERAEEELHALHANIIKTLAELHEYNNLRTECDIKQMLHDGKLELYFETIRLGESSVDFKLYN